MGVRKPGTLTTRAAAAQRQAARGGKRAYRKKQMRSCPCGAAFEQRTTVDFAGGPDCVRRCWRVVWLRSSGEPMPERLRALVSRENAVNE
jgi:hypothetical protein